MSIMNKLFSIIVAAALLLSVNACNSSKNNQHENIIEQKTLNQDSNLSVYQKAGIINVRDPKAVMVGYRHPGDNVFEISLDDVGKYTGHICAGVSSAFLLTKKALEQLYPNGEIPVRGQISIASSDRTDLLDVAAYIVRASTHGDEEYGSAMVLVDTTLQADKGKSVLVFKRHDNGKMVKGVFDKTKLMKTEKIAEMQQIKLKVLNGIATDKEKTEFAENVQKAVKMVITDTPQGLITVKGCMDYTFE